MQFTLSLRTFTVLVAAMAAQSAFSQQALDPATRNNMAAKLTALLTSAQSLENSAMAAAVKVLTEAAADPNKAGQLFRDAKKDEFDKNEREQKIQDAQNRKGKSNGGNFAKGYQKDPYRQWLEGDDGKFFTSPVAQAAMQIQCKFALLTLKAYSQARIAQLKNTDFDPTVMSTELLNLVKDAVTTYTTAKTDAERRGLQQILGQSITAAGPIAEKLHIEGMQPENWPNSLSPNGLENIFNKLFFEPAKREKDAAKLRRAWNAYIALMGQIHTADSVAGPGAARERMRKDKEASDPNTPEKLHWRMETDCFSIGDEVQSAQNMYALILRASSPKLKTQWIIQLRELLGGGKNAAGTAPTTTTTTKPAKTAAPSQDSDAINSVPDTKPAPAPAPAAPTPATDSTGNGEGVPLD